MYILGINISHHASSCLIKDGEILYFVEESKIERNKNFEYQTLLFNDNDCRNIKEDSFYPTVEILKQYTDTVDYVIFTSYGQEYWDDEIIKIIGKKLDDSGIKYKSKLFYHENHHVYHAANSFYFSGFDDAVALVMDGGGSYDKDFYKKNIEQEFQYPFRESESIYKCDYTNGFTPLFKHYSLFDKENQDGEIFVVTKEEPYKEFFSHSVSCGNYFAVLADLFDTGSDTAGKIMGLSSYGSEDYAKNPILEKEFFYEFNGEWVSSPFPYEDIQNIMNELNLEPFNDEYKDFDLQSLYPDFYSNKISKLVTRTDKNKFEVEKYDKFIQYANIAKKCQVETERQTIRLIQKALDLSGSKNIVLSGGYFLNCVNNFNYLKHFPDVNFFVDPISHDGGTSIGAAKWLYYGLTGDKLKRPLETLYLGK